MYRMKTSKSRFLMSSSYTTGGGRGGWGGESEVDCLVGVCVHVQCETEMLWRMGREHGLVGVALTKADTI